MIRAYCDGCNTELSRIPQAGTRPAITGERINGFNRGGLPEGRFDWCLPCAQIAFTAVKQAQQERN